MLSQLTTEGPARPFAASTFTSVESPRMVVVIGATVTVARCGRTSSRVRSSTGRALSSCATWIGRIRPAERAGRRRARRARQAPDPGRGGEEAGPAELCRVVRRGSAASGKLRGQADGVLGEPGKLRIRPGAGKDLGIACRDHAPALALERPGDDCRPAAPGAGADDLVNELDKLVWESNSDL